MGVGNLHSTLGDCYGLNCVPSKEVEILVPNTYQCDLICK